MFVKICKILMVKISQDLLFMSIILHGLEDVPNVLVSFPNAYKTP